MILSAEFESGGIIPAPRDIWRPMRKPYKYS